MHTVSLRERFEHIIAEVGPIIREVNYSLDRYEALTECDHSGARMMIEGGALVSVLRRASERAESLLRSIPGPNQVPASHADEVIRVTRALFRFVSSCQSREEQIVEDTEQLLLR